MSDDDWTRCDPAPFRKVFIFENLLLGHCCLHDDSTLPVCGLHEKLFGRDKGDCTLLFDTWGLISYCGPRYVKKYNLKPIGG